VLFAETDLPGAYVIEPEPLADERGFFARVFDAAEFERRGLVATFPQWSISYNRHAGTLRGMHFQTAPKEEVKMLRCTAGALYDVIIDLRRTSRTYTRWCAVELTAANRRSLYVPQGFAHGFQTLVDDTEVFYHVSATYEPSLAWGVRWDDSAFGIRWPVVAARTISDRDRSYPDFVR
jgi:dTDP-4-dehydrorhamnose 3,5-epimerase